MTQLSEYHLQEVEASTLKQWLEQQNVLVIDVREPAEYALEHIPGTKLLSLSTFNPEQVSQELNRKIVLCCQSGRRSAQAAQRLLNADFTEVAHLKGGLSAWKAAGYSTVLNKSATISLVQQVQIVAVSLVFLGTILGAVVSPWFLLVSGLVGAGLIISGISNNCVR